MKNLFQFIAAFAAIMFLSLLIISCAYAQENSEDIATPVVEEASNANSTISGDQTNVAALLAHVNKKYEEGRSPSKHYSKTYNDYRSYRSSRTIQRISTRRLEGQIGRVNQRVIRLENNMNKRLDGVETTLGDVECLSAATLKSVGSIQRKMVTRSDLKKELNRTGVYVTLSIIGFILALAIIGGCAAISQRR